MSSLTVPAAGSAGLNEVTVLTRARRYLDRIPPAVAGCGGDVATWRTALALVKGFNLTPEAALPLLQEWNASCMPPWTDRDLRAKLAGAARSRKPGGYLLISEKSRIRAIVRGACLKRGPAAEQSARRRQWPVFREFCAGK